MAVDNSRKLAIYTNLDAHEKLASVASVLEICSANEDYVACGRSRRSTGISFADFRLLKNELSRALKQA